MILRFESVAEFLEGDDSVAVLVELSDELNDVVLEGIVGAGTLLDFLEDVSDGGFGEDVVVVLHVLLGVLVGLEQLELVATQEDGPADQELLLHVVALRNWVLVLLPLQELPANPARVLVAHLIDLDGVVPAVERYNELPVLIIGLSGHQLSLESEDVHVLLEHLLHVNLGRFGLEGVDGAKRVLGGSVAVVGRDGLVHDVGSGFLELDGNDVHVVLLLEPVLGELVAVVDQALPSEDLDAISHNQILRLVVLLGAQRHPWTMGQDGLLSQLLSLQQHREGETTAVLIIGFLDFN